MPLPAWMYSQLAARGLCPCGHPRVLHDADDCPSCQCRGVDDLPEQD
ncbi:hypothetical protein [Streptomyces goshikiensis]